jgi:hypothetical protein
MERSKIIRERPFCFSPASQITLAVDLAGELDREELNQAIRVAVRHHARLMARIIQEGNGDCFFTVDPEDDPWETAIVHLESDGPDQLEAIIHDQERLLFDVEKGELLRFFVVHHVNHLQLVIVAHHLVGDGLALVYLLRDILHRLSVTAVKTPVAPLQQHDLATLPAKVKLPLMLRLLIRSMNLQWKRSRRVFSFADYRRMYENFWEDRETGLCTVSIAGDQLVWLMSAAELHHLSLDAILATAFLQAAGYENTAGIAVNLRDSTNEGMGHFSTGISIQQAYDANRSFWENAAAVQQRIDEKLHDDQKKYFMLKFMATLEPTLIDGAYFSAFDGLQDTAAARVRDLYGYGGSGKGVSLMNLDQVPIPDRYGPVGLSRLVVVPPLAPNATRVVGAVLLGDQLMLSMQHLAGGMAERNQQIFAAACASLDAIASIPVTGE